MQYEFDAKATVKRAFEGGQKLMELWRHELDIYCKLILRKIKCSFAILWGDEFGTQRVN